jgi:hypothetical protein
MTMGFFILLGLIAYVVLAKFVVSAIGKYTQSKAAKYVAIAAFVLIPTWDIIPGWLYFNHLCKEAGVKVLKTVEVDRSYFLPNGEPNQERLKEAYPNPAKLQEPFSPQFHIKRSSSLIQEKNTGEILGTATGFSYYGGWFNSYLFPEGPPSKCPDYLVHGALWNEVIKVR